jgi:hypothetical protein
MLSTSAWHAIRGHDFNGGVVFFQAQVSFGIYLSPKIYSTPDTNCPDGLVPAFAIMVLWLMT